MSVETLRKHLNVDEAVAEISVLPRWYAMHVDGDCMSPILKTGDVAVFDTEAWPERGDLAVVYVRGTKDGVLGIYPWVKRITMGMRRMKLPYRPHPDSDVMPLLSFESNIPGQAWTVMATSLYGLHRFIGMQDDLVWVNNLWMPRPKGKAKRRKPAATALADNLPMESADAA